MHIIRPLLSALFLLLIQYCAAQVTLESPMCAHETDERINSVKSFSIFTSGDITYTGLSTVVALEYERKKHGVYIGPKFSFSDTYLPQKGPLGANVGYKFYFVNNLKRWKVYVNADFQTLVYKSFRFQSLDGTKKNYINEVNIGYGIQYLLGENFYIGNSLGLGKYYESYFSYKTESRTTYSGYDALIRVFIKYKL